MFNRNIDESGEDFAGVIGASFDTRLVVLAVFAWSFVARFDAIFEGAERIRLFCAIGDFPYYWNWQFLN